MNALLTRDVLAAIAKYAGEGGSCADAPETRDLLRRIHEYLSFSGAKGHLKKWCLCSDDGCFSLPPDMGIPLKYIDNGRLGRVWDKWFEFSGQATQYDCTIAVQGMFEDVNNYYTVYDGPKTGFHVIAIPYGDEEPDAHVVIQGFYHGTNTEVRVDHDGKQYLGEYLDIDRKNPAYSRTIFSSQLGQIVKTKTKYPVRLDWFIPETREQGMLVDLAPRSEATVLRRYRLEAPCEGSHKLTVLGRTRLKDYYEDDEILPFDNLNLYISTAQMLSLGDRNDMQTSVVKEQGIQNMIKMENEYNRTTTSQPSINKVSLMKARQTMNLFRRRY